MAPFQSTLRFIYTTCLASLVSAQAPVCTTSSDNYVGNTPPRFSIPEWIRRGICVRTDTTMCYPTLLAVLTNLNELRKAEYGGAAGALALLPTIGALKLGTTTDEVWTLLNMIPLGGVLAMALSFGGTIMPMRAEEYTHALGRNGSAVYLPSVHRDKAGLEDALTKLEARIEARLASNVHRRLPLIPLIVGLVSMIILLLAAQAAMTVVELGGVLSWWCTQKAWIHCWYFLATLTSIIENLVRLPFRAQYKFYVSDVPYEITLERGDSVLHLGIANDVAIMGMALRQLPTLRFARVRFADRQIFTNPRQSMVITVSVVGVNNTATRAILRLCSKALNIGVFIMGTFMFASVTLVPVPMALLLLVVLLSASIFGRAIVGWLVRVVSSSDPFIHVITEDEMAANHAVKAIFGTRFEDFGEAPAARKVQVEFEGHIFVDGRRVFRRSPWYVHILGVMSKPWNLLSLKQGQCEETELSEGPVGP